MINSRLLRLQLQFKAANFECPLLAHTGHRLIVPLRLPDVAGPSAPLPTALTGRAGKLRRIAWRFRPSLKKEVQAQNEHTEANRLRMEQQIIEYKKREAIAEDFQLMGRRRDDNRP